MQIVSNTIHTLVVISFIFKPTYIGKLFILLHAIVKKYMQLLILCCVKMFYGSVTNLFVWNVIIQAVIDSWTHI